MCHPFDEYEARRPTPTSDRVCEPLERRPGDAGSDVSSSALDCGLRAWLRRFPDAELRLRWGLPASA